MLNFTQLAVRRGPRKLLSDITLTVHAGHKVGIVGRNGTGKSTLFGLILGELSADQGSFSMPSNLMLATVRQETPELGNTALDHVLDGDREYREVEQALRIAEQAEDGNAQAHLHERLHAIDGYAAPSRAGRLLYGLGFEAEQHQQCVRDFSGGWRMRLNLAQALMCRSDLLLLDEPTNHLDLDAVIWLQDWLRSYQGTLLVVSHDRDFLDAVCDHMVHLEKGTATLYKGNYSTFERTRAERIAQQDAQNKANAQRVAHLQKFVDRFRAKATKATQAQSRLKQIEKIGALEPAHRDSPFNFEFKASDRMPSPMLRMDAVRCGYGETTILSGLELSIEPGDRIGLLGRNGAGKSTLIRTMVGDIPHLRGDMHRDRYLQVGYFTQHTLESLDPDASPMLHMQRLDPAAREQPLRSFLGGFDFRGDQAMDACGSFSGGEKARLALAMIVYKRPNLLLLDEPTNHLDMEMRHALEMALHGFEGAVVLVSHDRHLVDATCDRLWLVSGGGCAPYEGDLNDYGRWLLRGESKESNAPRQEESGANKRQLTAAQRRKQKPMRDALRALEQQVEKHQLAVKELTRKLEDPALYEKDPAHAAQLAREQAGVQELLDTAEAEWMDLAEQLESAQF